MNIVMFVEYVQSNYLLNQNHLSKCYQYFFIQRYSPQIIGVGKVVNLPSVMDIDNFCFEVDYLA